MMKYSQAIRLGSKLGPQGFGDPRRRPAISLCANEAARVAFGIDADAIWRTPLATSQSPECPVCEEMVEDELCGLVVHLNDDHRWSREQIADFVEDVELKHDHAAKESLVNLL